MSKGDLLVERGAERLQQLARWAAGRGDGFGEWLAEELEQDADFLRKLKPSLVTARARAVRPKERQSNTPPQPAQPKKNGVSPLLVIGAAFAAGIVLARVIDWRGHAHPRD